MNKHCLPLSAVLNCYRKWRCVLPVNTGKTNQRVPNMCGGEPLNAPSMIINKLNATIEELQAMQVHRNNIRTGLAQKVGAVGIFISTLCALGQHDKSMAAEPITDIVAKKGFIDVRDFYKTNDKLLFCVQLKNKKWAFWNPQSDSFVYSNRIECTAKYNKPNRVSSLVNTLRVDSDSLKALDAFDPASRAILIANNGRIFRREDYTMGCHANFDSYYEIITPEGQTVKFYVILKHQESQEKMYICEGFQREFAQKYDVLSIDAVFIDDMTFFFGVRDAPGGYLPLLLLFRALPESGWTNHLDVYIIPYDKLHSRLTQLDHYDYEGHYNVVLETIKQMDK